tara:strand:+ start:3420 stop:4301 length:882 start_codon:yes stop_codon:yes gene_type:complete
VELQDQLETLKEQGLGVAAISYDSVEVLSDFARRRSITFPLLADDDSGVITEFGILNTVAAEGVGDNADNPEVQADVAKYVSAFGANPMIVGTPYPGTFMIDGDGKVTSRFFEEFYRERNTTTNVMLKLGMGLSPIAAVEGETAHLKFTAYPSNTSVTVGTRFSLALDVTPGPKMHVYAPGAEEKGYKVIGFNLDQPEIARIEPVSYPESEIYYFEPLDEHVPVYQEKFTILQEVVMNGDARAEEVMSTMDALTLTGTLDYQACDDAICFLPQSIPVSFTVDLEMPDRQRANR